VNKNFVLFCYYNFILLGDPADYDELVSEDAGIEANFEAGFEAGSVSMEDANTLLNVNDDDMDTGSSIKDNEHSARMDGNSKFSSSGDNQSTLSYRDRKMSVNSTTSSKSVTKKSDTLMPIYHSTAKARETALPSRILGGGRLPLILALWCPVGRQ
jgi:hypothetical protein